jgi:hypothetical protein
MLGCPKQDLAPLGPCTVSAVSERVDQSGVSDVDLLFMIDNSGSMASKQKKLAAQLPKLVQVLTLGDRYPGVDDADLPAGVDPQTRKFTAVKTMHLGVVTSNMGGLDDIPTNQQEAVQSCAGLGQDGKLQNSTDIAVEGVIARNDREFDGYKTGDVVLPPHPECDVSGLPKYIDYDASMGDTPQQTSDSFACIAAVGVRGCPFEQQLEATWKALAPNDGLEDPSLYKFLNNTKGQGENYNDGFLRPDAILATLIISDEEDCSITDAGKVLFALDADADTQYGPINLRCGYNSTDTNLVHDVKRYIDGLKSLKPDNPDRVIFTAIVGVPQEAIKSNQSIPDILKRPDMQFAEQFANGKGTGIPVPSCTSSTGEDAYPPTRMLEVAQGFGDQAVIYSICEDDYGPALDKLIEKIASKLKGNCLPRQLNPGDNGKVNCEVFELLPTNDDSKCRAEYGLDPNEKPVTRVISQNGKNVTRKACKMNQLAVTGADHTLDPGNGWYYDNFSESLKMDCNPGDQQRISFRFEGGSTDLPSGAGATFECFQPVARIDNNAKGFDAVNTRCDDNGEASDVICGDKSNDDYKLICIDPGRTCQISCKSNPQCPPGWVCAFAGGATTGERMYCQLPTCPADTQASGGGGGSDAGT